MELLSEDAVDAALPGLGWHRDGAELEKVVRREGFAGALAYVNEVGRLAEEAGHHPDIAIHWDTVTLRLSTHSRGGITDADLALASQIDALPEPG
ncbi:MAG TPA: 4a-hydroxytetrahydrobiopterin dehydratase [Acidimicrobiales bacterium]|nr:4a-hydroxytetrahydrobiopterin dehydratase [Acidimicrobiales bacterium]